MIRPLQVGHGDAAVALVARVVAGMRSQGIEQWDEIYPDRERLVADLESGEAFGIFGEGGLIGYVVLNEDQAVEYDQVPWVEAGPVLVIHRLCVDPQASGRGLGRLLLGFSEAEAARRGCRSIRLDAFKHNPRALGLYERNGYVLRGIIPFRKGLFHCYEKALSTGAPHRG